MKQFIKILIARYKHKKFCKLNGYYCPDCIYHDFIFEGVTFRGNKCREPNYKFVNSAK